MGLMRIRVSSFLSGFAVAAGISLYQLKKDLQDSHALLREQVRCRNETQVKKGKGLTRRKLTHVVNRRLDRERA